MRIIAQKQERGQSEGKKTQDRQHNKHTHQDVTGTFRSQLLLSLAFPTLYPRSEADFVYPRLRLITYGHGNNCQSVAEKHSLRNCIKVSFCRIWRYTNERLPVLTSIRIECLVLLIIFSVTLMSRWKQVQYKVPP